MASINISTNPQPLGLLITPRFNHRFNVLLEQKNVPLRPEGVKFQLLEEEQL